MQALYQVFVCWAAKVHKDFPPLWSKDAREWVQGKTGATRNEREDVRDEWERIQDFSGARYIEYVLLVCDVSRTVLTLRSVP
jgi:hypothetical protein